MIDHLVYITRDLVASLKLLEAAFGVPLAEGGRHPKRGTRNYLVRIGPATYLEVLAPDVESDFTGPRWMGLDLLPPGSTGRLSRWACAVPKQATPKSAGTGAWQEGQRRKGDGTTLRWRLTDPGAQPLIQAHPFLIDWLGAPPPAEHLPPSGVTLQHLTLRAPEPPGWPPLGGPLPVRYEHRSEPQLVAQFRTETDKTVILV